MKALISSIVFVHLFYSLNAQKRTLDYQASENWPTLQLNSISNNGKFVTYLIYKKNDKNFWTTIQATDHNWKIELPGLKNGTFTADSRMFIFTNSKDSLGILDLGSKGLKYIAQVRSFKLASSGSCLAYQLQDATADLIALDLLSGKTRDYANVNDYLFDDRGQVLLLQVGPKDDSIKTQNIVWVDLSGGSTLTIDHNLGANEFEFDDSAKQLVYLAQASIKGVNATVLKYYRVGRDSAFTLVDPGTAGMKGMSIAESQLSLSKAGDKVFFRLKKMRPSEPLKGFNDSVHVKIRNYKDEVFSEVGSEGLLSVIHTNDPSRVVRLEQGTDFAMNYRFWLDQNDDGDYALVRGLPTRRANPFIPNDLYRWNLYLVATKDGSRKLIKSNGLLQASFSLTGKYVIWFDEEKKMWTTYRIADGTLRNITTRIPTDLFTEDDNPVGFSNPEGLAGWLENDQAVLIYDRYDIWQVDPDGIKPPVNITSGFGLKNHIRFRYMDFVERPFPRDDFNTKHPLPILPSDTLILSALDIRTKKNGFFAITLAHNAQPWKLSMGNYACYFPFRFSLYAAIDGIGRLPFPLKSKLANAYIAYRMDADKYPNLCFTTNFRDFTALTNLEPQKEFNWYSSELIHFVLPTGHQSEGILYKPEDFDSHKKYPVIFYYYEKNADALHFFIHPELSNGSLNIPWFVSHGYLVFVPDIVYDKPGYPGECAYHAINAAADALCRMPWVDSGRLGLQGHSFGGWETNYIVTRTNRFAAAASSSGYSDAISFNSECESVYWSNFEIAQGRIGSSFWKHPELYIANSPLFNAEKVRTPMLLLHDAKDSRIPFLQGFEWYNGLARLQKKVWLVSYADDGHTVENEKNQLDYSIRLAQFFDHYLKGAAAPQWMTRDNYSLELDANGKKP